MIIPSGQVHVPQFSGAKPVRDFYISGFDDLAKLPDCALGSKATDTVHAGDVYIHTTPELWHKYGESGATVPERVLDINNPIEVQYIPARIENFEDTPCRIKAIKIANEPINFVNYHDIKAIVGDTEYNYDELKEMLGERNVLPVVIGSFPYIEQATGLRWNLASVGTTIGLSIYRAGIIDGTISHFNRDVSCDHIDVGTYIIQCEVFQDGEWETGLPLNSAKFIIPAQKSYEVQTVAITADARYTPSDNGTRGLRDYYIVDDNDLARIPSGNDGDRALNIASKRVYVRDGADWRIYGTDKVLVPDKTWHFSDATETIRREFEMFFDFAIDIAKVDNKPIFSSPNDAMFCWTLNTNEPDNWYEWQTATMSWSQVQNMGTTDDLMCDSGDGFIIYANNVPTIISVVEDATNVKFQFLWGEFDIVEATGDETQAINLKRGLYFVNTSTNSIPLIYINSVSVPAIEIAWADLNKTYFTRADGEIVNGLDGEQLARILPVKIPDEKMMGATIGVWERESNEVKEYVIDDIINDHETIMYSYHRGRGEEVGVIYTKMAGAFFWDFAGTVLIQDVYLSDDGDGLHYGDIVRETRWLDLSTSDYYKNMKGETI